MKKETLTKPSIVCLLAMLCCFLWGSAFPSIKIGYTLFTIPSTDYPAQLLFAGIRFTLAGILVILLGSLLQKTPLLPQKNTWSPILKLALVQTVLQYLFFYIGLAHTTGVKSSIIVASNVFFSILIASLLFHYETLTPQKCLGCLAGFAGVVIINLAGGSLDMNLRLTGEGAILLSALSSSLSAVLIKKYSATENPVLLSGYQFLTGGILLTLCGYTAGGRLHTITAPGLLLLLYLSLVSAAAYTLWGILLKHNPVSQVAVFGFMNPMFGVLLSALLLHEKNQAFSPAGLLSLLLVCAGIYTVNRKENPAKKSNKPDNQLQN